MSHPQRRDVMSALTLATLGVALSSGCATGAVPGFEPTQLPSIPAGQSRVVVYFLSSWTLPNRRRRVQIDDRQYGEIGMGEFMVIHVASGRRQVRLWRPGGLGEAFDCACEAQDGQTMYVRFVNRAGISGDGSNRTAIYSSLDLVPAILALKQLNGMSQVERDKSGRSFDDEKPGEIADQGRRQAHRTER